MDTKIVNKNNIMAIRDKLLSMKEKLVGKWGIYGTGNGAEIVYMALQEMEMQHIIHCFIERDDFSRTKEIHGRRIMKLGEALPDINGILVGAFYNHKLIAGRVKDYCADHNMEELDLVDIFEYNSIKDKEEYIQYIEKSILKKSGSFVDFEEQEFVRSEQMVKAIAWYLPQFHQMEINDKFHGKGFTEWTNTTRAIPVFTGHYQPHIPYDVGYYDLLNKKSMERQIYLAKHYGIYGFCIHYYWFSGRRIMDKPLKLLLDNPDLDIPFCLDWATENWTALWDGGDREIMLEQTIEEGDERRFMADILPYMKDRRYIRIHNKPVLVVYRVNMFEKVKIKSLLDRLREIAKAEGLNGLYIMLTNAFGFMDNVKEWGGDALVEFPPHGILHLMDENRPSGYINPYFNGIFSDAADFIKGKEYMQRYCNNDKVFRSAMTAWDNTARKATSNGRIIYGLTPDTYRQWLMDIIQESYQIHSKEENIVFINSWNEWGEGAHLEPDMKYGYAYLQATRDAIVEGAKTYDME